jgi:hypothetical protein
MKVRNGKKNYHKKQKCCYRQGRKKDRNKIPKEYELDEKKEELTYKKELKEKLKEFGG